MKYLFVKMRRDLTGMWAQFLSVFLMAFLGIFIYVGMEGTWFGMETELDHYFTKTNLATAWAYGNGMTSTDLQKIKGINGVVNAELSGLLSAKVKFSGVSNAKDPDLRLNFDTTGRISAPLTITGTNYSPNGSGIWIDSNFAKANHLKPGDSLNISVGDVQQTLQIRGLILSSEYIYYTGAGSDAMPNAKQHGFAFIGLSTAETIMNETVAIKMQDSVLPQLSSQISGAYQIAQKKADTESEQAFEQAVEKQKQNAYTQAVTQADMEATQTVNAEFHAAYPNISDYSSLSQYQQAISNAKAQAEARAKAIVDKQFETQQAKLEDQLATAKAQAENFAKAGAIQAILKKYNLTEEQFDAIRKLIALPEIRTLDNAAQADTAGQFVTLLKNLPDSMLEQDVDGFSLATLKQVSVDYNLVRIQTTGNADTQKIEKTVQDVLGNRYTGFSDRNSMVSVYTAVQKAQQIQKMSVIFSMLFFLLALLTMQTTMARLVDTQRIQIGTMKALGLKNWQIRGHYALYGLTVGLLGGLLGLISAPFTISPALLRSQATEYALPEWPVRLTPVSFAMVGVVSLCCVLATLFACRKGLTGMPAETMRGLRPKAGRQVVFEKMPRLWAKVSFGWKWTIRDIARSKIRSVMGIVGVLGCMMLLIAGFGMQYTCNTLPSSVYGKQYTYKALALLSSSATKDDRDELYKTAEGGQWIEETSLEYKDLPNETETLTVVGSGTYIHLKDAQGTEQQLPDNGVLITQRIATLFNLKKGDRILFRTTGEQNYTKAIVSGIVVIPTPQGIFISSSAWHKLGKTFTATSLLVGNTNSINELGTLSYVQEVTTLSDQYISTVNSFKPFNFIFLLLKAAAILLDIVILYNLGLLSFTERTREYATLKVLGFYQKEIRLMALRENIVTTIMGWLVGIPAGLWFLNVYVRTVSSSSVEMTSQLSLQDFGLASIITVGCSLYINLLLSHKVRKIDMVGALKSIE